MSSLLNLPSLSHFKLAAFDMDSTLITMECIDEMADFAGIKPQVAAITEATMRGEIKDFRESLLRRVALLEGLPAEVLEHVYAQRLHLTPGAQVLCAAFKKAGLKLLLVSGGFTFFADKVAARLSFDDYRANALEIVDGHLTGRILPQAWGDVVDGEMKKRTLLETAARLGITPAQTIAIGDGANDLPMMSVAGLSVAYRAKPKVQAAASVAINEEGLDRLLAVFNPPSTTAPRP